MRRLGPITLERIYDLIDATEVTGPEPWMNPCEKAISRLWKEHERLTRRTGFTSFGAVPMLLDGDEKALYLVQFEPKGPCLQAADVEDVRSLIASIRSGREIAERRTRFRLSPDLLCEDKAPAQPHRGYTAVKYDGHTEGRSYRLGVFATLKEAREWLGVTEDTPLRRDRPSSAIIPRNAVSYSIAWDIGFIYSPNAPDEHMQDWMYLGRRSGLEERYKRAFKAYRRRHAQRLETDHHHS